jgi:hypothetical protein
MIVTYPLPRRGRNAAELRAFFELALQGSAGAKLCATKANSRSLTAIGAIFLIGCRSSRGCRWVRDDRVKRTAEAHPSRPSQVALQEQRWALRRMSRSKLRSGCGTPVEFPARRNPELRDQPFGLQKPEMGHPKR